MIAMTLLSNRDALLVAVPMVGIMIAGHFRLDELFGKSQKPPEPRRKIAGTDDKGFPLCMDPDGAKQRRARK